MIDSYLSPTHQKSPHKSAQKSPQKSIHKSHRKLFSKTAQRHNHMYERCTAVWHENCGKMVQKEIRSLDKSINIKCPSGSIIVHQTIFNCIKNNYHRYLADKRMTGTFQEICRRKQMCKVDLPKLIQKINRFMNSLTNELNCQRKPKMWVIYSCLGGSDKTPLKQDHNHPDKCTGDKHENGVEKSIPSLGGWIHMKCPGGCLTIHKAVWGCRLESATQLRIVRDLCQGKDVCRIDPGKRLLGKYLFSSYL